jgi:hypothetical protein
MKGCPNFWFEKEGMVREKKIDRSRGYKKVSGNETASKPDEADSNKQASVDYSKLEPARP